MSDCLKCCTEDSDDSMSKVFVMLQNNFDFMKLKIISDLHIIISYTIFLACISGNIYSNFRTCPKLDFDDQKNYFINIVILHAEFYSISLYVVASTIGL